jgi:tetratricopeptide (TPR) repeat protein
MPELSWTDEEIYLVADRGFAFFKQGCYQEAGIIFEGLTTLDPLNAYCRKALSTVCMVLNNPQRAVRELSMALNQNPADHDARARRCEAYCSLQSWNEARQDLEILRRNGHQRLAQRAAWRMQAAGGPTR